MGRRQRLNHPGWHLCWYTSGRYWKRALSKARRREIKGILKHGRAKAPTHYETIVNYKNH